MTDGFYFFPVQNFGPGFFERELGGLFQNFGLADFLNQNFFRNVAGAEAGEVCGLGDFFDGRLPKIIEFFGWNFSGDFHLG